MKKTNILLVLILSSSYLLLAKPISGLSKTPNKKTTKKLSFARTQEVKQAKNRNPKSSGQTQVSKKEVKQAKNRNPKSSGQTQVSKKKV
jgi:hypothetical protein